MMGGFATGLTGMMNGGGAAPIAAAPPVAAPVAAPSLMQKFGQQLGMPISAENNKQMHNGFAQMMQQASRPAAPMQQMPHANFGGGGQGNALGEYLAALMNKGAGR